MSGEDERGSVSPGQHLVGEKGEGLLSLDKSSAGGEVGRRCLGRLSQKSLTKSVRLFSRGWQPSRLRRVTFEISERWAVCSLMAYQAYMQKAGWGADRYTLSTSPPTLEMRSNRAPTTGHQRSRCSLESSALAQSLQRGTAPAGSDTNRRWRAVKSACRLSGRGLLLASSSGGRRVWSAFNA